MHNDLMVFEETEVEVFELNRVFYFNPYHVGSCLGLTKSSVRNHLANMNENQARLLNNLDVEKGDIRKLNNAGEKFLTESGVYRMIFRSNKPNAEKFSDWVTDEVLPTLRKEGSYSIPASPAPDKVSEDDNKLKLLPILNETVGYLLPILQHLDVGKEEQLKFINRLYFKADVATPSSGKVVNTSIDEDLYTLTDLAHYFGIYSAAGKPHPRAVGALMKKLNLTEHDFVMSKFTNSRGLTGTSVLYKESAIDKLTLFLNTNGFPRTVVTKDINGFDITYTLYFNGGGLKCS